jgi:hypothetical protein
MEFNTFNLFLAALAIGGGGTLGYYTVNVVFSLSLTTIQKKLTKRSMEKAIKKRDEAKKEPKVKLCARCKVNERPNGGLYCKKCQFEGLPV